MNYALITGASKGIGKAIALELAKQNCSVLLIARSEELLSNLCTQITTTYNVQANYLAIDLTQQNAAQQVLQWLSEKNYTINILVNNAGFGLSGAFNKYSLQQHNSTMHINMAVPIQLTYLLLPMLQKQPSSYIANICSGASYQAVPGLNVYAASKAFLLSFSRGLQYELKNTTVSVTAISPGATDTNFAQVANVNGEKAKKLAAKYNMQPNQVASIAVKAMFAKKTEIVVGFINKVAAWLTWLLPKKISEKMAASIYDL